MKRLFGFFGLLLLPILAAVAQAGPPMTPEQAIARVLGPGPVQASWFDAGFLAQIPLTSIQQVVDQYTGQGGKFERIEKDADSYTVYLDHTKFPARAGLNADGQFTMLWFGNPQPLQAASLAESVGAFGGLLGKVSVAVVEEGTVRASLHPDQPLAVGSAFKLAIIDALSAQIVSGKHRWDEVVPLRPEWKSLPSGVIRSWPDETPLTLATLANEMVSISDNTAADALLSIAGRENVEAVAPHDRPFLSTREAFILKDPTNGVLLARYRAADAAGRRALLAEIDRQPLPDVNIFARGEPIATDIEWFFTAPELCSLIDRVRDLGAMQINPGLAGKKDWLQIAYKGGSEPGVLNFTTAVTGKNHRHYCVAATWNSDGVVDENRFATLYTGVLASLAAESGK